MNSLSYFPMDIAIKSTALLLAAFGVTFLLRRISSARRALIWSIALLGILALPGLRLIIPTLPLRWLPVISAPRQMVTLAIPVSEGATTVSGNFGKGSFSGGHVLEMVWCLGSAAVAGYFAFGYISLRKMRRDALSLADDGAFAEIYEQSAVKRPVRILSSDSCEVPVTWGWLRPVVLLPAASASWPASRLRHVLRHELAHIQRGDWLIQLCACMACAIYWWNPLVWLAARCWRNACEEACDNLVLAGGSRPSEYAEDLLVIVKMLKPLPHRTALALTMARATLLNQRIVAILDVSRNRRSVSRGWFAGVSGIALFVFVGMAGATITRAAVDEKDSSKPNQSDESGGFRLTAEKLTVVNPIAANEEVEKAVQNGEDASKKPDAVVQVTPSKPKDLPDVLDLRAEALKFENGQAILKGKSVAKYQNVTVSSAEGNYDSTNHIATFSGDVIVTVVDPRIELRADKLTYDMEKGELTAIGKAKLKEGNRLVTGLSDDVVFVLSAKTGICSVHGKHKVALTGDDEKE